MQHQFYFTVLLRLQVYIIHCHLSWIMLIILLRISVFIWIFYNVRNETQVLLQFIIAKQNILGVVIKKINLHLEISFY